MYGNQVPGLGIDVRDGAFMTALMWAAFHGRTEQVRVLIAKGADPSAKDMDGMTAVHWSIQKNDTRVLQVWPSPLLFSLGSSLITFVHAFFSDAYQFRECSVCRQERQECDAPSR